MWAETGLPSPVAERGEVLVWKGCKPDSVVDSHLSMRPVPAAAALNCFMALMRAASRRLFGLAPDGVFRAADIATGAVGFYPAVSPLPRRFTTFHVVHRASRGIRGGLLSVALSVNPTLRQAAPACAGHRALRSLDFPPPALSEHAAHLLAGATCSERAGSGHPPFQNH